MPKVTTTAYIINNRFSNNPCDVPIVCGNYSVLGYGWFVRVSNVFSNGCGGYFEIGTEIPENYTVGHDPSEFIKLLHIQSINTNIWVSETKEELITLCKCTPTNFTLIVDNGDGTYTAIFPTGSGLPDVTWGSGGGSGFNGEVLTYGLLPDPTLHPDEIWFVKTGANAGPYYSDGVTWFSPITNILSDISTLQGETNLLLNNVYKVTYYEIVSGASGTITPPVGATFNADEFGDSGNSVLSKINVANKPTFESPQTAGGVVVTANLNTVTGAWTASGTYTDPFVALIYSINISAQDYSNLNNFYIIETVENWNSKLGTGLTNAHIFVGNAANVATDVSMSGDTTIDNLGAVTIGVNKVNYDKLDVEGELAIIAAFRFLSRN